MNPTSETTTKVYTSVASVPKAFGGETMRTKVGDDDFGDSSDHEDHYELLRRRLRRMMMVANGLLDN